MVPVALKMDAYLSEFLWRLLVGGPAFANFCDSLAGNADHLAGLLGLLPSGIFTGWAGVVWVAGYLGILAAGRDLLLLVGPWAFGKAGGRCAHATAGEGREPGTEREQEEAEGEFEGSEDESEASEGGEAGVEGSMGGPHLPPELRGVLGRQAETSRLQKMRAARKALRRIPNNCFAMGRGGGVQIVWAGRIAKRTPRSWQVLIR